MKGVSTIIVAVIVILIIIVGFYNLQSKPSPPNYEDDNASTNQQTAYTTKNESSNQDDNGNVVRKSGQGLFGQQCTGGGDLKLDTFPIDVSNIEFIVPMGRVQDSHVTPTDHQYIIPVGTQGGSLVTDNPLKYEIKAPADGYIINIELFKQPVEEQYKNQPYADNYLIVFEHTCDFYTRLIHIDTLSEQVRSSFAFKNPDDPHPFAQTRIPVKEGQVIGTVGSHSFDFQIINTNVKNEDIISPQNIDYFSPYTVDTFDYLSNSLKAELVKKNIRKVPPLGGDMGYDIEGKLVGNWFKVGRQNRPDYWVNSLGIVYDHIDPTQIRISFGEFSGYPKAYGVKGNSPDPADVSKDSGMIKYELVTFDYHHPDGKLWDTIHFVDGLTAENTNNIVGIVIFQLVDDMILKVETFPGKTAADVEGFVNPVIYER